MQTSHAELYSIVQKWIELYGKLRTQYGAECAQTRSMDFGELDDMAYYLGGCI